MPLVRGIRLLNSLETGNVSGACLETIVSCPARAADFVSILQSPGFACLAASSNTSTHAITRSNTALNTLAQTTVGACIYYTTPAFANNFAQSGAAFDNLLTSNDSFKHFSNSALTMNCSFATGSQFITCAAASNTNLARMFTCPITTCCIFGSVSAMASLANNANIVSYLFNDATAAACFSTYGGATAVCNAFNGPEYINYILQEGKTCAAFACAAIGPYAFTSAISSNCFIKNACALCVLVNLPACCALGTSCTFTCFAASPFGLACATAEYVAGNTAFVSQVFSLNSCAQIGGLVTTNPFISAYYRTTLPFNDKFNCFWQNCCNCTCGGRNCCPTRQDLSPSSCCVPMMCLHDIATSFGLRTPCMECFMTNMEAAYYNTAWCSQYGAISVSNNGNFMMLGGGYQGTNRGTYPMCICCNGVNYCNTLLGAPTHTDAKVSGFCVVCPAMLYSNNNGCVWQRMPGFCIANTFFTCLCCDGFDFNACTAGQCGRVEIQWGLGSFTCCNGIWTGFRINDLCCKNHAIFGYACTCLLANNTPGPWTVCMKPHPFVHLSWCCGYFSGIGGECDFNTFSVATCSGTGCCGCYQNTPDCNKYCGSYRPRFIMGKLTGSQPSVGFMLSSCMDCACHPETCSQLCHGICGVMQQSGCQNCKPCEVPVCNPFCCSLNCFFHTELTYRVNNPTITFMTCVHANTENMRTYMVQIAKEGAASTGCEEISVRSSCTVLEWNCGNVQRCALKTTILGTSDMGCAPLGGAVALGNTILWMTTPWVQTTAGTVNWYSFHCDRCNVQPFFTTCSQFVWGTQEPTCSPESYPQYGKPFTPCNNCSAWTCQTCCGACTNEMRHGFTIRVDYTSNTFFAINCIGCSPSCGWSMYFNWPNAGNTASHIYGCCACGASVYPPRGVSGHYCNIGTTMFANASRGPYGVSGPSSSSGIIRCMEGNIPGCPMQAFCESFMLVQPANDGATFDLRGWPCAIVYSGSCCWNWGSTPCTACAGSPAVTPALVCQEVSIGRCGFTGASYGWTFTCPHCMFSTIGAFGGTCCQTAHASPRFVCTANGMPAIVNGALLSGTGFYANGQTFSTCVFKLRFIDMF